MTDLAELYEQTRLRLAALVGRLGTEQVEAPVPACPGWNVGDVVAHLAAVAEDAVEGRLSGPPDDATTAAQVARFRGVPTDAVLLHWEEYGPRFAEVIGTFKVWPGLIDVVTHEHDIRGAISQPGERDSEVVLAASSAVLRFEPPTPFVIQLEDGEPHPGQPRGTLVLRTTRWEALRWRLGRRSMSQLAAMDWSADPGRALDGIVIFGPSPVDIVE
ncbi:MAG: maleylpyruvate isomerase N-terminal domain-containing protein [Acidimicrobiales bacterium]